MANRETSVVSTAPSSFQQIVLLALVAAIPLTHSSAAQASSASSGGLALTNGIANIFNVAQGWHPTQPNIDFSALVAKARRIVQPTTGFKGGSDDNVKLTADRASADRYSTTIKFQRTYKGIEVVGHDAIVHFNTKGEVHDVSGKDLAIDVSTVPVLSADAALKIVSDRAGETVGLSEPAKLNILKDFEGKVRLTYHMLTATTASYAGQDIYLDAHTGQVVVEFPRALDAEAGDWSQARPELPNLDARDFDGQGFMGESAPSSVYSADTDEAHQHVDPTGRPTSINPNWYVKVLEDGQRSEMADSSAENADRNAQATYAYYASHFNRHSYDNHDGRLNSIVHIGNHMNNAFWTDEYHVMAYGDGDGEKLTDLTVGVDVGGHELTHGVTGQTAKLMYVGESGALNESYSDFFGKMVANDGNWDVGRAIMAPPSGRRALRNMESPEEFKQPGSTDSPFMIATSGPCTNKNDHCGVHTNSGIPSKAAVLIFQALGKEKTEVLYYKVLTTRLAPTSGFADARHETEEECGQMFGGPDADECRAVSAAFDAVRM